MYELLLTEHASGKLLLLEKNPALKKRLKAVRKALSYLEVNPRHPSLNTHKYLTKYTDEGKELFEAYAENKTPGAYRIFWSYGPGHRQITVNDISPHP
tara:strand:+ start:87242 stop:87535 length:294 start_codon:yes stop_codon:yes gene_type:complete